MMTAGSHQQFLHIPDGMPGKIVKIETVYKFNGFLNLLLRHTVEPKARFMALTWIPAFAASSRIMVAV